MLLCLWIVYHDYQSALAVYVLLITIYIKTIAHSSRTKGKKIVSDLYMYNNCTIVLRKNKIECQSGDYIIIKLCICTTGLSSTISYGTVALYMYKLHCATGYHIQDGCTKSTNPNNNTRVRYLYLRFNWPNNTTSLTRQVILIFDSPRRSNVDRCIIKCVRKQQNFTYKRSTANPGHFDEWPTIADGHTY